MRKLRRVEKGSAYLVTKKCNDDLFFLVPDPMVDMILLFSMLAFAERHKVVIHAFCFLSNHFHMVVTDRSGRLPDFMRDFLCNSSKALKVRLEESRSIWSSSRYSAVRLLDLNAAERKIVYTLLNPVRAKLVGSAKEWPGLTSARWKVGDVIVAQRPPLFFTPEKFPDEVSTRLVPVSSSFGETAKRSEARIQELLVEETREVQREMKAAGESFAGVQAVLRTARTKRSTHAVCTRNPRFATTDKALLKRAIEEDVEFHRRHIEAKARYLAGDRQVLFPTGTYWYRALLRVRVERSRSSA